MKYTLATLGASLVLAGCASGLKPDEHAAHHPPGAAAVAPATPMSASMDMQMKAMQAMHEKMVAAKTPEERAALMKDHMKAMQDGMAMMDRMKGGMDMGSAMSISPGTVSRRMDMMEMMMRMMMDREAMRPPAAK